MSDFVKGLLCDWKPEGYRIELNVNRGNSAIGFYEHMGMVCDRQGDFPIGKGFYMNDFIYIGTIFQQFNGVRVNNGEYD